MHQAHGLQQAALGQLGHIHSALMGAAGGHRRGAQQTLVQQGGSGILGRAVGHGEDGQLFQHPVEGQQHQRGDHIKGRVNDGNAHHTHGIMDNFKMQEGVQRVERSQEQGHADHVEIQVNKGGPLGVFAGAHAGDHGRNAGADVLAHNDGNGTAVGDRTGQRQSLQNAHAGRRTLNDGRQAGTGQHAQNGVGEMQEQAAEPGHIGQRLHGRGHELHAGHQNEEAQQDVAHAFFLAAFAEHGQDDAHKGQNGAEGAGLQHLDPEAVALNAGQAEQPAGDGGAHVAAHDDAHGLVQLHDAAVDEAHHHNRGGGGALNHGGHAQPQQKALEGVVAELGEDDLQFAAGLLLQRLSHQVHTI